MYASDYFNITPPNQYSFLGFYQHRSKQNDFKFSFRKEANILRKSLKAILSNSSNSEIIESAKSLEESFESETHTTTADSLRAVYLMTLRARCGLQKSSMGSFQITETNSGKLTNSGTILKTDVYMKKSLERRRLKMARVVTQGTSKATATVMENVDIRLKSNRKHNLPDTSKRTDEIKDETAKRIKATQDPSFNLEESDEQNNGIMKEESQKAKNYDENISSADESDLEYPREQMNDELNSVISSIYEDEDEENSLDGSSDEEDTAELADVSFNSFVGSKTDNKNYNWKLKNNESVRGRLINRTKEAIEEAKKTEKVDSKLMSVIRLGLSSIIDLSSEFKGGMHSWFGDNWIPLKNEVLSKINLKVERFTGEVSELITKVENLCDSYDYLGARKLVLEKVMERPIEKNPYIFIKRDGRPQNHTEIQYVMILSGPILDIIFSDQRDYVRLIWGESVSQVTNDSRRKIDLCIRTEDGTKELSHSECAREATFIKILKDRSKSLRTNKCILNNFLESNILDEALEDTAIFGLQLAALEGQLIGIDLLDEGLYFGFNGPAFRFPAQICSIGVLRQTLEEKVIKKAKHLLQNSSENKITKLLHSENIE
ncbi:11324_t:CDS:10, partial [Diversispora eburnea]